MMSCSISCCMAARSCPSSLCCVSRKRLLKGCYRAYIIHVVDMFKSNISYVKPTIWRNIDSIFALFYSILSSSFISVANSVPDI